MKTERIQQLKKEIEQLNSQLPRHSIKPSMMMRLDELEEELAALEAEMGRAADD